MIAQSALEQILDGLTPDTLLTIIVDLADRQPAHERASVNLMTVMETLIGDHDLGTGSQGWAAQLKLKRAIGDTVRSIPGVSLVEGDA